MDPLASASTFGPPIDHLYHWVFWICSVAFVGVHLTLVVFCARYYHRRQRRAQHLHASRLIEVLWTGGPAIVLLLLALTSQSLWSKLQAVPAAPPDVRIKVLAEQWLWQFSYAGHDGQFDTSDDVVVQNEAHVPVGQTLAFDLSSHDVVHGFYIPALRVHRDVLPGLPSTVYVEATVPGRYEIRCTQFCGTNHYQMGGILVVESPTEYRAWLTHAHESVF